MADDPAGALDDLRRAHDVLTAMLAERDAVLARLTARLLVLERGQPDGDTAAPAAGGGKPARPATGAARADGEADRLAEELARLRATRTFRWTAPGRAAWGRARALRGGVRRRLGARARP